MSDELWKKINNFFGLLPLGAIFGLVSVLASVEVRDLDIWLHLAMGRFITTHQFVPNVDVLSCSIQGTPWINHEWLFQVLLYNVFDYSGYNGLITMQIVVVTLTVLLLLILGYNKDKQLFTSIFLFALIMVFQQRFTIRPDIFSLFFFAIYIFILALHIDKRWAMPVLFVVQVLWSNIHGFFFFGPLFILIGLFSEWLKRNVNLPYEWNDIGRLTDEEYRRLRQILVAVILACFLNPYFVQGAWYPIRVFFSLAGDHKIFFSHIQELQKPITWETLFNVDGQIYFKVLIFISTISFILNRRRIDVSALLFWIVFLIFSLNALRNVSFFAFAAYLVIVTNAIQISFDEIVPLRFVAPKFLYLTAIVGNLMLLLYIVQYAEGNFNRGYFDFDKYENKSEFWGVSQKGYPYRAVDFLVKNKIKGQFFNDFNSGAYLLGRCYPNIKVYIDGRTEVYGAKFFENYLKMWDEGNPVALSEGFKKNRVTGVLLNTSRHDVPENLVKYFIDKPEIWKIVYFDYDGIIFLKNIAFYQPIIKKFEIDLSQWKPKKMDLFKLGSSRMLPIPSMTRAMSLYNMGYEDQALAEALEAIHIVPGFGDPYGLIGKIYIKRGEFQKAFEYLRVGMQILPGNKDIRMNFAQCYYELKQYEIGIKQGLELTRLWPQDSRGHYLLAKLFARQKRYDESFRALRTALRIDPKNEVEIEKVVDVFTDLKNVQLKKEVCLLSVNAHPGSVLAQTRLADVLLELGDSEGAVRALKVANGIDPKNEKVLKQLKILEK